MTLDSNEIALRFKRGTETDDFFPEVFLRTVSISVAGGPAKYLLPPGGRFGMDVIETWAREREKDARWGGRNDRIGLLHICRTRDVGERAEIAVFIECGMVEVVPESEKENAVRMLRPGSFDPVAAREDLKRIRRAVAANARRPAGKFGFGTGREAPDLPARPILPDGPALSTDARGEKWGDARKLSAALAIPYESLKGKLYRRRMKDKGEQGKGVWFRLIEKTGSTVPTIEYRCDAVTQMLGIFDTALAPSPLDAALRPSTRKP